MLYHVIVCVALPFFEMATVFIDFVIVYEETQVVSYSFWITIFYQFPIQNDIYYLAQLFISVVVVKGNIIIVNEAIYC